MRKQIVKSLFAMAIAASMVVTSGEAAFAAAPAKEMKLAAESAESWKEFEPSISYVSVDSDDYSASSGQQVSWYGKGRSFNVYVNGKLNQTVEGDTYGSGTEADPYYADYDNYSCYVTGLTPGAAVTIKVVATDAAKKESASYDNASESMSITVPKPEVTDVSVYTRTSTAGIERSGYSMIEGAEVRWYGNRLYNAASFEIWRSTVSETAGFVKIATVPNTDGYVREYVDKNIANGATYYYKVRVIGAGNADYGFSPVDSLNSTMLKGYFDLVLNKSNQPVLEFYGNDFVGVDIYRSTKQTKKYKKIASTNADRYTDASVKSGKTYYYKVIPYRFATGKKKVYGFASEPTGVKLTMNTIREFKATPVSAKKVKLTWKKVSGAKGYDVYMTSDLRGDGYKLVKSLKAKKKSLTVNKLAADHSYTFVIQAYKKKSKKKGKTYYQQATAEASTGLAGLDVYTAKRVFSSNAAKTEITAVSTLKWSKMVGISGYKVSWNDPKTGNPVEKYLGKGATSYVFTQKFNSTTNSSTTVTVTAYRGNIKNKATYEETSDSETLGRAMGHVDSISVARAAVVKYTSGEVVKDAKNGVTISWRPVAGATDYDIYRYNEMDNYSEWVGNVKTTSIQDWGLLTGVNYRYVVSAENDILNLSSDNEKYDAKRIETGWGGFPTEARYYGSRDAQYGEKYFSIATAGTKVTKVSNKKKKKAVVKWNKAAGATGYAIYRSNKKKSGYAQVATVGANKTSYTDSGLTKKKTYYYKVVVLSSNELGMTVSSGMSNFKNVKIKK